MSSKGKNEVESEPTKTIDKEEKNITDENNKEKSDSEENGEEEVSDKASNKLNHTDKKNNEEPIETVDKNGSGEEKDEDVSKKQDTEEESKNKTKKDEAKDNDDEEEEEEEQEVVKKRPTRGSKRNIKDSEEQPSSKRTRLAFDDGSKKINFACDKKTSDGNSCNLKISSWNVAGLRAWIKKEGSLDYVLHQERPDMMILLETKCADNKLPPEIKIPDYQMYTVTSQKEGYCGVLLYTKIKPLSVQYGIGNKELDSEGRCIIAEFKDFYLVCTYVPNAGQGLKTLQKKLKWNTEFLKLLKSLDEKKPVILSGDLNVAHEPVDLANPKTNTKNAGFTKEERQDFTKLLDEGFIDTFRHLYPDQTGAYTFWSNRGGARSRNVGWRLDYFVISKRFQPHLCDSIIRSSILGSDHCPITLCLHV